MGAPRVAVGAGGLRALRFHPGPDLDSFPENHPNTEAMVATESSPPITCARAKETVAGSESEGGNTGAETSEMSIADLLRTDPWFDNFEKWAEETMSPGLGLSWLEIWGMSAGQMGDDL